MHSFIAFFDSTKPTLNAKFPICNNFLGKLSPNPIFFITRNSYVYFYSSHVFFAKFHYFTSKNTFFNMFIIKYKNTRFSSIAASISFLIETFIFCFTYSNSSLQFKLGLMHTPSNFALFSLLLSLFTSRLFSHLLALLLWYYFSISENTSYFFSF